MTAPEFDFTGKTVMVFGGTSGINLGIAKGFAAAGARLGVASRSQDKVDAAVAQLGNDAGPALGFSLDVRDAAAVKEAVDRFVAECGRIDVLVSGAAGNFLAPAAGLSSNGFKTVIDIDLLGTFNVLRAGYDGLAKPGGCIINISAPQSWIAMPMQVHACAAKAGIDQVTRTLAMEWGPEGIRVNSIAPGPIAGTEGMDRLAPNADAAEASKRAVPLGRWGEIEEIANMAMFLASDLAGYVSGAVIPVDGASGAGRSMGAR